MKGRAIPYSADELAWIEARKKLPRRELHELFCARFERDDISLGAFKSLCKRKGWMTGRTGRYEPGREPENKGKKMPYNPNSARTQFKKGNLPHNFRGPGHERIDNKDGYVVMIVDETNPWTGAETRPVHKHRYLWEKVNGPVPKGHVLKCLDGDKTNCDPSNWQAVPQAMLPRLAAAKKGVAYDTAPMELKPTIIAVAKLEQRLREAKRRNKA